MAVKIISFVFILACMAMGIIWGSSIGELGSGPEQGNLLFISVGALAGIVVAIGILGLLSLLTQEIIERSAPALAAIVLSMIVGYAVANYIWFVLKLLEKIPKTVTPAQEAAMQTMLIASLVLLFGFAGISLGLNHVSRWQSLISAVKSRQYGQSNPKLVDTSVIIDGRILDIIGTGFVEGTLLVPRFVLQELQNIADSPDELKRARGRRGLDILKAMQERRAQVQVEVIEEDPRDVRDVDGKLVRLAREFSAKILTNDLNLNKVAQIEGVTVLNINDLANALKPMVLPEEKMHVRIVKEGREPLQGVGYLDDGTMIVVDGGRDHVGKDVAVTVTSVLQTSAGRMIFTKLYSANA
jgi:uncharacterized protein YacL